MLYFICFMLAGMFVAALIRRHLAHKYEEWPTDKTF
jgi:uncharacterized membrane protein YiaA